MATQKGSDYDYKTAMRVLTDGEKNRILCLFFNGELTNIDYKKATNEFGAASVESMKISVRNAYKKIQKAPAQADDDDENGDVGKTSGSASSKKRKGKKVDEGEETPSKKAKKGGKGKGKGQNESEDAEDGKGEGDEHGDRGKELPLRAHVFPGDSEETK